MRHSRWLAAVSALLVLSCSRGFSFGTAFVPCVADPLGPPATGSTIKLAFHEAEVLNDDWLRVPTVRVVVRVVEEGGLAVKDADVQFSVRDSQDSLTGTAARTGADGLARTVVFIDGDSVVVDVAASLGSVPANGSPLAVCGRVEF